MSSMTPTRIHELFDARVASTPGQAFLYTLEATLTLAVLGLLELIHQLPEQQHNHQQHQGCERSF